ncbi:MAG: DUF5908 family protein [Deltaproteobacteria bacterium]|nr:DUF5908 family protein [Deltaproteobacteria bacterium]
MPVIIHELIIKASVDIGGKDKTPAAAGTGGSKPLDRKELIEECVEEVLKILERKGDR